MAVNILTMYGNGSGGTENALANIDIPEDGTIVGVQVAHSADFDADGEGSVAELSFIATNQLAQNDIRGALAVSRLRNGVVTQGGGNNANNVMVSTDLPVAGGERLYIHVVASAGVNTEISFLVHFQPRGGTTRRSARRR